jgi:hypothetical protein
VQYAVVEYESHRAAAMARRRLVPAKTELWGKKIIVEWAIPQNLKKVSSFFALLKAIRIRNSDRYLLFIIVEKLLKDGQHLLRKFSILV